MSDIDALSKVWIELKNQEEVAVIERRAIEDQIVHLLKIKESLEGVETIETVNHIIKVTGRIDRKVNSTLVQELASENGLTEHLSSLFRWTPAINMRAWRGSTEEITKPLMDAITSKPCRPSFKITLTEEI